MTSSNTSTQRPQLSVTTCLPAGVHVIKLPRGASRTTFDSGSFSPPSSSSSTNSSNYTSGSTPSTPFSPSMVFLPQLDVCSQRLGSSASASDEFSPMQRERRSPPPDNSPPLNIQSTPAKYTIRVQLPDAIKHEMVTLSALKGDKLKVIADAWHMENDCHYEWLISFPPHDIDMSGVHAKFDPSGLLAIDVRRRQRNHVA